MTRSTDEAWEDWAVQEPYYSVLTDPRFRAAALTPGAREEFFESGRIHVEHVINTCRERLDPGFVPARVLDFGCGIGRLVIAFARVAREVVGVDISPTMLALARRNCDERSVANVTFQVSDDLLSAAEGQFDLVHTSIVLQHIEVPRGRSLFRELVRRVRPGGCGAVQITFAWDVYVDSFGQKPAAPRQPPEENLRSATRVLLRQLLKPFLGSAPPPPPPALRGTDPEMQMNFYNLSELFFILHQEGAQSVHSEITDHGGALGSFLFFRMPITRG